MSECVVRMEMPKGCGDCLCANFGYCGITHEPVADAYMGYQENRPKTCPILAVLPENHGRLVDADALIEDVKTLWDYETVDGITSSTVLKQIVTDIQNAPTIAAPRWVRCEDRLPEPHKDVLVTGMEAINNHRVYKVMVNDNGEWRPKDYAPSIRWDYWMPIEPPREDADVDN